MFSKNIFALLSSLKAREEGRMRPGHVPAASSTGSRTMAPSGPAMGSSVQQGPVYSRYDQERFRGKEGTFVKEDRYLSLIEFLVLEYNFNS